VEKKTKVTRSAVEETKAARGARDVKNMTKVASFFCSQFSHLSGQSVPALAEGEHTKLGKAMTAKKADGALHASAIIPHGKPLKN